MPPKRESSVELHVLVCYTAPALISRSASEADQKGGCMVEPVRVFVSHHHSPDKNRLTAQLVRDLAAIGADVWVDATRDYGATLSSENIGRPLSMLVPARRANSFSHPFTHAARSAAKAAFAGVTTLLHSNAARESCESPLALLARDMKQCSSTR